MAKWTERGDFDTMNRVYLTLLVAILIAQGAVVLILTDIGQAIKQHDYKPILAQYKADLMHLTHPETITRRTIDWILKQGEFGGAK